MTYENVVNEAYLFGDVSGCWPEDSLQSSSSAKASSLNTLKVEAAEQKDTCLKWKLQLCI